jgi:GT2 family glycosyltransferase
MSAIDGAEPLVSILVVTYKQHRLLAHCLESVAQATHGLGTETIVVVNGVPLEAEHRAAEAAGRILLHAPINLGLPGGLQWARSHARGRYLAVVQDDVVVDEGWLDALVETLERDPTVGAVGSRVLLADGSPFSDGIVVTGRGRTKLLEPMTNPGERWTVDACFSASCLVRAEAWDEVGGPNHRLFPNQYVDADLGLRFAEHDWSVLMARDSPVRHVRNASTTAPQRSYLLQRNSAIMARDHAALLADRPRDFPDRNAVDRWLEHLDELARQRRSSPSSVRSRRRSVPLSVLTRDARRDARRVRLGVKVFPVRVALFHVRTRVQELVRRPTRRTPAA